MTKPIDETAEVPPQGKDHDHDTLTADIAEEFDRLNAEVKQLAFEAKTARDELLQADKENAKLESQLRVMNERYSRMQTRLDNLDALMERRTTALCALIELRDPKWVPNKEDMEP